MNPDRLEIQSSKIAPPVTHSERWKIYASIGIIVCSFLLHTMLLYGRHFSPAAVYHMIVPLCWAIFLLASYRSAMSRFGAWVVFGIAVLFLWMGIESNLKFAPFWIKFAEFVMNFSKAN